MLQTFEALSNWKHKFILFFPPSNDPIPEVISRDFGFFFTGDEKKKMCCSSIEL
jgi:hypothetical protein